MTQTYFLEGVDRVLHVLDCFSMTEAELRLTDFSERLGLPKSQVLRILSTLEAGGYLIRDPVTKRYRLSIRFFHLGMIVRSHMDLRRIARPCLEWLATQTGETARLVVPDEAGPVCMDQVESPRSIRVFAQVGARMPWNAGASALVILAYLPEEQRERILAHGGFKRYTDRTITEPDRLRAEALTLRQHGYYISTGTLDEDAVGVSAPIFDDTGAIAGTLNFTAPLNRLPPCELERDVDLVCEAARETSIQLGYQPELAAVRRDD